MVVMLIYLFLRHPFLLCYILAANRTAPLTTAACQRYHNQRYAIDVLYFVSFLGDFFLKCVVLRIVKGIIFLIIRTRYFYELQLYDDVTLMYIHKMLILLSDCMMVISEKNYRITEHYVTAFGTGQRNEEKLNVKNQLRSAKNRRNRIFNRLVNTMY